MADLPDLSEAEFFLRLTAVAAQLPEASALDPELGRKLFAHYQLLRRWAKTVSLVGPGFADELFERHYGEALAGLALLASGPARLLDVGSGAGFPGIVLAAARPDLDVLLLEPRQRKWAFLAAACRAAGLSCRALNARVSPNPAELPDEISDLSIVTVRALQIEPAGWRALSSRLRAGAQVLLWSGERFAAPPPPYVAARAQPLGGERRTLREFRWPGEGTNPS